MSTWFGIKINNAVLEQGNIVLYLEKKSALLYTVLFSISFIYFLYLFFMNGTGFDSVGISYESIFLVLLMIFILRLIVRNIKILRNNEPQLWINDTGIHSKEHGTYKWKEIVKADIVFDRVDYMQIVTKNNIQGHIISIDDFEYDKKQLEITFKSILKEKINQS